MQLMPADRGQDNPLKAAIEQTPGLVIARTLPLFPPPYFKLMENLSPARGERVETAIAPITTLFVGLKPRSYDIPLTNGRITEVVRNIQVGRVHTEDAHYEQKPPGNFHFGLVTLKQTELPPVVIGSDGKPFIEDPDLQVLLDEAQRNETRTFEPGMIFDTEETTHAQFYPSREIAILAADLHQYHLDNPNSPYPTRRQMYKAYGAMIGMTAADLTRLASASDEKPILEEIGSRFIPGYTLSETS